MQSYSGHSPEPVKASAKGRLPGQHVADVVVRAASIAPSADTKLGALRARVSSRRRFVPSADRSERRGSRISPERAEARLARTAAKHSNRLGCRGTLADVRGV